MNRRTALFVVGLTGFLGIALGAFGAHALKHLLSLNHTIEVWHTAVLYHLVHAPVLFLIARSKVIHTATFLCFSFGILLFSGSLYGLALSDILWLGAITPFGGLLLMAGWVLVAVNGFKESTAEQ